MSERSWWIYHDDDVHGPFSVDELANIDGLSGEHQICPEEEDNWRALREEPELVEAIRDRRQSEEPDDTPDPPSKTDPSSPAESKSDSESQPTVETSDESTDSQAVNWYFKMPDGKSDPFTLEELRNLPALKPDLEVRRGDQSDWRPAREVDDLADAVKSTRSTSRSSSTTGSTSSVGTIRWALLIGITVLLLLYVYILYF